MPRNLDRRVELLIPVEEMSCRRRLITILDTYFRDTRKARKLQPAGGYEKPNCDGEACTASQEVLFEQAREAVRTAKQSQPTMFEPHKAIK